MTAGLSPRPGILDIEPYVGGNADLGRNSNVVNLASNESALGPSPDAIRAYQDMAATLHRYPDGSASELREALGRFHGLKPAQIVCGAGSDELLTLLGRAYAGPGDEVVHSAHGFLMYGLVTKGVGATAVVAPETNLTADVDQILAKTNDRTRIVFLANPNNPTGTYLPGDEITRLRDRLPEHVLLVLDAAYAEYISRNNYDPGTSLVESGANVVVTRTFSKIYGLAALRLGWAYCPPGVADVLNRLRGPFNVSAPALAAAVAAVNDVPHTDKVRSNNDIVLPAFLQACKELGLEATASIANFALVRFPSEAGRDAAAAFAHLQSRGILVRRMVPYGLPDCLRITIGTQAEMDGVRSVLREFVA